MTVFDVGYFRVRGWWRDETLSDWLERCRDNAPDRAALLGFDGPLTYAAFAERIRHFAAGLADAGIGRGDVVIVQLPNLPEFLIAWLAINALGAVMQTVHMPYGIRDLEHRIAHAGAKACIALARLKDRSPAAELASLRGRFPALQVVVAVGGDVPGAVSFAELLACGRDKPFVSQGRARGSVSSSVYLGHDVIAESSFGHLQSLPQQRRDVRG